MGKRATVAFGFLLAFSLFLAVGEVWAEGSIFLKNDPSLFGINRLLPPTTWPKSLTAKPPDLKIRELPSGEAKGSKVELAGSLRFPEIKEEKPKDGTVRIPLGGIQVNQLDEYPPVLSLDTLILKDGQRLRRVVIWSQGAIHRFRNDISFAQFQFKPAQGYDLSFKVEFTRGYVFVGGRGEVVTPAGETISLDDSKKDFVLGSPAGK
jgi:hypothetical protein